MKLPANNNKLVLPTTKGMIFVNISEVAFFKSDDIYCSMNDIAGNSSFVSKPLKWVEGKLRGQHFYRVHNCYLVNLYNVAELKKNGECYLIMECGTQVPVSRGRRLNLLAFLGGE